VLLAGADLPLRALLTVTLARDGCAVVGDGVARGSWDGALDLVICDLRTPGPGLDRLRRVRDADWAVPVIAITRPGDLATSSAAERLGVAAVFESPFALDDLRTVVLNLAWLR
jgi:DNA-binding NtrC family response regulator